MRVREANQFDFPILLNMLRAYRGKTPLPFLAEVDDEKYIVSVLTYLLAGKGVIFVAEDDLGIVGMLMAQIAPSLWSPSHFVMQEMAYWVNPEARGGTAGYRLLYEYVKHGKTLKKNGRIRAFFISKMSNSPNLKFEKFGFDKLEETWVI